MPRVRPIPKDKYVAQNVIKSVMKDNPLWPWAIGNNINLEEDIPVTEAYDRLRFFVGGGTRNEVFEEYMEFLLPELLKKYP